MTDCYKIKYRYKNDIPNAYRTMTLTKEQFKNWKQNTDMANAEGYGCYYEYEKITEESTSN